MTIAERMALCSKLMKVMEESIEYRSIGNPCGPEHSNTLIRDTSRLLRNQLMKVDHEIRTDHFWYSKEGDK